ncbi:MAG: YhbY family RNA-binding protein [Clostridia bacterium]|nr:YhbY family RNA-binding protein [Clostridia bacterium]
MITSKQRAFLRGKANDIDAIFQIGKDGIHENLIAQLNDVLEARELIKIKVLETAMLTAREASEAVCEATGADPVQCIGTKFVIYRPNSEKPVSILPKA